jgi:cytochrome b involved in lipid metabolism
LFLISNKDSGEVSNLNTPAEVELEQPIESNNSSSVEQTDTKTIAAAEVSQHNSENDCWTIINGKVYDITSYIPRHPGGNEILLACGKDGTSLFTSRTDDDGEEIGSGTPHSTSASNQLKQFLLGDLED